MKYKAAKLIKKSRMITYFDTLEEDIQKEVLKRIDELVKEEKEYCDKGNFSHMSNILSLLSIYEVLQKHGFSEEEAYNIVKDEMHKFVQPFKEKFQKLSKKKWFWSVIKKLVPIGFKHGSGVGWRYTWHKDTPKNEFRFETNECIYAKIFKKRGLEKLGPLFCQCDVINYGSLDKIDFQRTKTLCYGDDECNFIFINKGDEEFERTNAR
ncbi:MAG: L-2-amino-thiazoline-4-carboxylic acid hydrolase [Gammaproteobacteria bacterium]|nr:L-2-amino-thiazoline-4-carboxylic acid hydrolase [Gammaproteobacteria bacterium]